MVGRREHFLKSNFESLSGGIDDVAAINNSISNKYKSGTFRVIVWRLCQLFKF